MKKDTVSLFLMVDACGWEIIRDHPFLNKVAPYRHKLRTVFGYSSACVPSIVSGRWPDEHLNWCYFTYDPENSPFQFLRWMRWFPRVISSRRTFRRLVTRLSRKRLGFEGYFDLYNIPFQFIDRYDFTEKKSPLRPGGMNRGENIFDLLQREEVPSFVGDPTEAEEVILKRLTERLERGEIEFGFVYWAGLDGLLHSVGNDSPEIAERLDRYQAWIEEIYRSASQHYNTVNLHVFSDHGMANCDVHLDLAAKVEALPLKLGRDYMVVYDSTMARFWFKTTDSRRQVETLLREVKEGRIMDEEELRQLRAPVDHTRFGELFFLVEEGTLIVPSHMGEKPIRAMHGYHPDDPHSDAALFTNVEKLPCGVKAIPDLYQLMVAAITKRKTRDLLTKQRYYDRSQARELLPQDR